MISTTNRLILYFGLSSSVVNPALVFAPLLVGGAVSTLGFSTDAAVTIISAELMATAVASIPALWWATRSSWRKVAIGALLAVIVGNLVSYWCDTVPSLLLLRTLTGFFEGTLLVLYLVVIAQAEQPERVFGGKLALQMITGAVGLAVFPLVIGSLGVTAVYFVLALASVFLLFGVNNLLESVNESAHTMNSLVVEKPGIWGFSSLLLLILYGAGVNVVWTYLERVGEVYGLALETIGLVLSGSLFLAILSGMLCAVIGIRFGRLLPISVGLLLGTSGALTLFLGAESQICFILGVCFISIARVVPVPYLFGCLAVLDRTGKLAVLSHVALAAGMAAGPVFALLPSDDGSYRAVFVIGILFMVATWFMALKITNVVRISEARPG